jgi:hypothetical protein
MHLTIWKDGIPIAIGMERWKNRFLWQIILLLFPAFHFSIPQNSQMTTSETNPHGYLKKFGNLDF